MKKKIYIIILLISFFLFLPIIYLIFSEDSNIKIKDNFKLNSGDIIFHNKIKKEPDISVYISDTKEVIKLNIEEYVRGVVAGEMPANFSLEALKAQAVASRTYALAHMEEFGGASYNKSIGANLIDTTANQVYLTKEERYKAWPKDKGDEYWDKITRAVEETREEILTYEDKIVMSPYYFSTSGGKTENCVDVFSKDIPYLKSVQSNGEEIAPRYTSSKKYSFEEFISIINKNYKGSNITLKNIKTGVKIIEKSEGGGVLKIKIGSITLNGKELRTLFLLNSTDFEIDIKDSITFICQGYGHRVGMSQWGANVMGLNGAKYLDILKHYYTGTKVKKIQDFSEG